MYYFIVCAIIAAIIIGVFFIRSYYGKLNWAKKKLVKVQGKWAKPVNTRRNFDLIKRYLDASERENKLSAQTANDLDLNSIFNYLDRTNSKPGKQYLYDLLHHPLTDIDALHDLDNEIEDLNLDVPARDRIEVELSKLNGSSAYYIIDLFLKIQEPVFQSVMNLYIKVSPFLILAAFVSLIIIPNIFSFIFLILLFVYNLVIHFTSRQKIATYTNALSQMLIMHQVAVTLVKSGKFSGGEAIKQKLINLTGLKRALFPAQWDPKLGIHVT